MLSLLIAIALIALPGTYVKPASVTHVQSQDLSGPIIPFNPAGMPVRLNTARVKNDLGASWVEYSVTNLSQDEIDSIYLKVFVVRSAGKPLQVKDTFSGEGILPGATRTDRALVKGISQKMVSFVAVSKVIGASAVWQVDGSALEAAIQSKLNDKPDAALEVTFQTNTTTTDADRAQIFELILGNILKDQKKAERLMNVSRIIVLRETVNFGLPQIPPAHVVAFDRKEIQEIADAEQRVIYLRYEPLTAEDSQVLAEISIRDARARDSGIHVPYKFAFVFTCVKENGRWVIEKSIGFARS